MNCREMYKKSVFGREKCRIIYCLPKIQNKYHKLHVLNTENTKKPKTQYFFIGCILVF